MVSRPVFPDNKTNTNPNTSNSLLGQLDANTNRDQDTVSQTNPLSCCTLEAMFSEDHKSIRNLVVSKLSKDRYHQVLCSLWWQIARYPFRCSFQQLKCNYDSPTIDFRVVISLKIRFYFCIKKEIYF